MLRTRPAAQVDGALGAAADEHVVAPEADLGDVGAEVAVAAEPLAVAHRPPGGVLDGAVELVLAQVGDGEALVDVVGALRVRAALLRGIGEVVPRVHQPVAPVIVDGPAHAVLDVVAAPDPHFVLVVHRHLLLLGRLLRPARRVAQVGHPDAQPQVLLQPQARLRLRPPPPAHDGVAEAGAHRGVHLRVAVPVLLHRLGHGVHHVEVALRRGDLGREADGPERRRHLVVGRLAHAVVQQQQAEPPDLLEVVRVLRRELGAAQAELPRGVVVLPQQAGLDAAEDQHHVGGRGQGRLASQAVAEPRVAHVVAVQQQVQQPRHVALRALAVPAARKVRLHQPNLRRLAALLGLARVLAGGRLPRPQRRHRVEVPVEEVHVLALVRHRQPLAVGRPRQVRREDPLLLVPEVVRHVDLLQHRRGEVHRDAVVDGVPQRQLPAVEHAHQAVRGRQGQQLGPHRVDGDRLHLRPVVGLRRPVGLPVRHLDPGARFAGLHARERVCPRPLAAPGGRAVVPRAARQVDDDVAAGPLALVRLPDVELPHRAVVAARVEDKVREPVVDDVLHASCVAAVALRVVRVEYVRHAYSGVACSRRDAAASSQEADSEDVADVLRRHARGWRRRLARVFLGIPSVFVHVRQRDREVVAHGRQRPSVAVPQQPVHAAVVHFQPPVRLQAPRDERAQAQARCVQRLLHDSARRADCERPASLLECS
ncbi:uncharacterized protein BcabD6B2_55080 [Babesia caballi]|uniref:Uncharacterized protein n=1 Tax=Babesia caballi TaxID=5871 RepID=A0AAV4M2G0_BABCB|nr:hypothetical protein BcabD6B2_55080 [Babesia caballi]